MVIFFRQDKPQVKSEGKKFGQVKSRIEKKFQVKPQVKSQGQQFGHVKPQVKLQGQQFSSQASSFGQV